MFGDSNNKNFFASLAGSEDENDELDTEEGMLVSSSSKPKKSSKKSDKEDEMDEVVDIDVEDDERSIDDMEGQLTIDVSQDEDHIYIESPVAGVSSDDLDISITPESVSIKGSRSNEERVKGKEYLYQECFWGSFSRSVILPQEIDPDKASASIKKGVLKITLPKINRLKSKKIKVKVD